MPASAAASSVSPTSAEPVAVRPGSRRAARMAAVAQAAVTTSTAKTEPVTVVRPAAPAQPIIPSVSVTTTLSASAAPTEPIAAPQRTRRSSVASDAPTAEGASSADSDLFVAARRAFGDIEIPQAPAETIIGDTGRAAGVESATLLRTRRTFVRKAAAAGSTFVVMGVTTLLAVSMTLPHEAVAAAQGANAYSSAALAAATAVETPTIEDDEIQVFVAPEDVAASTLERTAEDYSTVSLIDLAAQQGINYSGTLYTNDPNAAIQWPYLVGVAMSSGYGMRWGRMHEGIDLVPGSGAPIQAIADGVVRVASEAGGAYGVHVWIDHEIDGKAVSSHYAHMQYGSLKVKSGQQVKVGDIVGKTGNTGRSYGAHLHFEIEVNGSKVDPLPFMRTYAGTY